MSYKLVIAVISLAFLGACAQSGYNRPYIASDSEEEAVVESIDHR